MAQIYNFQKFLKFRKQADKINCKQESDPSFFGMSDSVKRDLHPQDCFKFPLFLVNWYRDPRRKLLDCICAILEYNAILEYRVILEFSILYSSITATSGWEERGRVAVAVCVCCTMYMFWISWRGGGGQKGRGGSVARWLKILQNN